MSTELDEIKSGRIAFGNNLRKIRKGNGCSQSDFADLCGISRAYYGRIERGDNSATVDMCLKIAQALGKHVSELFLDMP